ncbi:MAG: hypothetical protein JOZ96_20090 [Acidobacteria bacterium]|nr:hypothetical protein [Acidobacteriota bacterium]
MDRGEETIKDDALAARLRAKAAAVQRRALLVAAAITFVAVLFPER